MKIPKYMVDVAKDPKLPPGTPGNTIHLQYDWFLAMVWDLWFKHREAVLADRFRVIVTR